MIIPHPRSTMRVRLFLCMEAAVRYSLQWGTAVGHIRSGRHERRGQCRVGDSEALVARWHMSELLRRDEPFADFDMRVPRVELAQVAGPYHDFSQTLPWLYSSLCEHKKRISASP